ncbi:hypothetical protein [Parashewanella curva]|uniref:hypothetical protein n=1 Tax=Parashewanella curva TaxID=2338552 RepID=UPI00105A4EBB|nr:hypothetical protein [Parashewanella curva]
MSDTTWDSRDVIRLMSTFCEQQRFVRILAFHVSSATDVPEVFSCQLASIVKSKEFMETCVEDYSDAFTLSFEKACSQLSLKQVNALMEKSGKHRSFFKASFLLSKMLEFANESEDPIAKRQWLDCLLDRVIADSKSCTEINELQVSCEQQRLTYVLDALFQLKFDELSSQLYLFIKLFRSTSSALGQAELKGLLLMARCTITMLESLILACIDLEPEFPSEAIEIKAQIVRHVPSALLYQLLSRLEGNTAIYLINTKGISSVHIARLLQECSAQSDLALEKVILLNLDKSVLGYALDKISQEELPRLMFFLPKETFLLQLREERIKTHEFRATICNHPEFLERYATCLKYLDVVVIVAQVVSPNGLVAFLEKQTDPEDKRTMLGLFIANAPTTSTLIDNYFASKPELGNNLFQEVSVEAQAKVIQEVSEEYSIQLLQQVSTQKQQTIFELIPPTVAYTLYLQLPESEKVKIKTALLAHPTTKSLWFFNGLPEAELVELVLSDTYKVNINGFDSEILTSMIKHILLYKKSESCVVFCRSLNDKNLQAMAQKLSVTQLYELMTALPNNQVGRIVQCDEINPFQESFFEFNPKLYQRLLLTLPAKLVANKIKSQPRSECLAVILNSNQSERIKDVFADMSGFNVPDFLNALKQLEPSQKHAFFVYVNHDVVVSWLKTDRSNYWLSALLLCATAKQAIKILTGSLQNDVPLLIGGEPVVLDQYPSVFIKLSADAHRHILLDNFIPLTSRLRLFNSLDTDKKQAVLNQVCEFVDVKKSTQKKVPIQLLMKMPRQYQASVLTQWIEEGLGSLEAKGNDFFILYILEQNDEQLKEVLALVDKQVLFNSLHKYNFSSAFYEKLTQCLSEPKNSSIYSMIQAFIYQEKTLLTLIQERKAALR